MLIFATLTLAVLFIANQRLHASYLHPACIFSGLWLALLTGLILAGDAFNPISDITVLIYLSGAFSFTLGGRLVTRSAVRRPCLTQPALEVKRIGRIIDAGICILLALLPFYWSRLSMIAESSAHHVFLTGVRAAMVENQKDSFGAFTYVLPAGMLLSLVASAIDDGSRWARSRTFAIIAITLGYYAVTGSRLGSELTLMGVAAVGCLRSKRLHFGRLLLVLLCYKALEDSRLPSGHGIVRFDDRRQSKDPDSRGHLPAGLDGDCQQTAHQRHLQGSSPAVLSASLGPESCQTATCALLSVRRGKRERSLAHGLP